MKHIIFTIFALSALAMTGYAADCTEADNAAQYAICQTLETQCSTIITACNGDSTCLETVTTTYTAFENLFDFSGVTGCECAAFTCDENFVQSGTDDDDNSGAGSLIVSAGLIGLMKLFA